MSLDFCPVSRILPNPGNRPEGSGDDISELVASVERLGILVPLIVTEVGDKPGWYYLLDGERRLRIAKAAGHTEVMTLVWSGNMPLDMLRIVIMAAANYHRTPMTPVEWARAFGVLRDKYQMTVGQMHKVTGIPGSTISTQLRLLDADDATLQAVNDGRLSATSVRRTIVQLMPLPGTRPPAPRSKRKPARTPVDRHFNALHRLAADARDRCQRARHPVLIQISEIACGPCWEEAIAEDALDRACVRPAG